MDIQDLTASLDLKQNLNIFATCKQFDSLNLILRVYDNSVQADLTNYNVRLKAMKSDKVPLIQEHTGITISNNVVTIEAHEQLTTTDGNTPIELQFIDKTTGKKKATFNLVLIVVPSTLEVNSTISTATYTLLEELENKLDQAGDIFSNISEAMEVTGELQTALESANTVNANLNNKVDTANNLNNKLESNISSGATLNNDLETNIAESNTARDNLHAENVQAKANIEYLEGLGDVTQLAQNVQTNTNNISAINTQLLENTQKLAEINSNYNIYASVKSGNFYTVVDFKRTDGTLYCKSTLSNADSNGYFQTCIVNYYGADGTTIVHTYTWTLTYDTDGKIISKVVA